MRHCIRSPLLLSFFIEMLVGFMRVRTFLFTALSPWLEVCLAHGRCSVCWVFVELIQGVREVHQKVWDRLKTEEEQDASMQMWGMELMHSERRQEGEAVREAMLNGTWRVCAIRSGRWPENSIWWSCGGSRSLLPQVRMNS